MSRVCLIVLLVLFLSLWYTAAEKPRIRANQVTQTYIVSIRNDLKPSNAINLEEWYKSILRRTISNPDDSLLHVYKTVFHGFSAQLRPEQVSSLRAQVEVIAIYPDTIYQLHTTRTPHFLGLNNYHNPMGLLKESDLGSNIVVGVVDTGIWPESPSFSDEGLEPVPAHFKGTCDGGVNFPPCNKKIVGVRYFDSFPSSNKTKSARDTLGHGTHTSSTIAGRLRANASFYGYAKGDATGIAPKARLAIYKVCGEQGGCMGSDVLAGIDTAVEDGVDVISISLGGQSTRYNLDVISVGAFGAMQKGVFFSASAGNSGPELKSLSNHAPWMTSVGASTIDRTFRADVVLDNGEVMTGTSLYTGHQLPSNKTYPLAYFPTTFSMRYCMPDAFDTNDVKGKIVICEVGMISDVEKGLVVQKAGGIGVIGTFSDPSYTQYYTLFSTPFMTPGLTIPYPASERLIEYVRKKEVKGATIVFRGTEIGKVPAPVVDPFSSRGPNDQSVYVFKPDVIAPGVNILAAWPDNLSPSELEDDPRRPGFAIVSGTSMSCPHVSGVAALIKAAHPDWTPAMIQSAIMTTAYRGYSHEAKQFPYPQDESSSIWATGAGHVDAVKANEVGLVYNLTEDDYINFLCASKYNQSEIYSIVKRSISCDKRAHTNPWDLNYPAIVVTSEMEGKTLLKTLTSVDPAPSNYTVEVVNPRNTDVIVSPKQLSFNTKGEKQSFAIMTFSSSRDRGSVKNPALGSITWTDGKREVTMRLVVV